MPRITEMNGSALHPAHCVGKYMLSGGAEMQAGFNIREKAQINKAPSLDNHEICQGLKRNHLWRKFSGVQPFFSAHLLGNLC